MAIPMVDGCVRMVEKMCMKEEKEVEEEEKKKRGGSFLQKPFLGGVSSLLVGLGPEVAGVER